MNDFERQSVEKKACFRNKIFNLQYIIIGMKNATYNIAQTIKAK